MPFFYSGGLQQSRTIRTSDLEVASDSIVYFSSGYNFTAAINVLLANPVPIGKFRIEILGTGDETTTRKDSAESVALLIVEGMVGI